MNLSSGDQVEVLSDVPSPTNITARIRVRESSADGLSLVLKASAYMTPDELFAFGRECLEVAERLKVKAVRR